MNFAPCYVCHTEATFCPTCNEYHCNTCPHAHKGSIFAKVCPLGHEVRFNRKEWMYHCKTCNKFYNAEKCRTGAIMA